MKTRLIIQFSGWHENGTRTEIKFTILNIEGEVTMEIIIKELEKDRLLSSFRRNKPVVIGSFCGCKPQTSRWLDKKTNKDMCMKCGMEIKKKEK